jgi:hypothetical protein
MGNSVPTISVALVLGAFIIKGTDFVKYLLAAFKSGTRAEGLNGLLTLILTSLAGVAAVFVFKDTQWAQDITIGKVNLADLSAGSSIVFGLVASSFGSVLYDFKKAVDNTDTAKTPRVLKHKDSASPVTDSGGN